jgi:hypothetical protein
VAQPPPAGTVAEASPLRFDYCGTAALGCDHFHPDFVGFPYFFPFAFYPYFCSFFITVALSFIILMNIHRGICYQSLGDRLTIEISLRILLCVARILISIVNNSLIGKAGGGE